MKLWVDVAAWIASIDTIDSIDGAGVWAGDISPAVSGRIHGPVEDIFMRGE